MAVQPTPVHQLWAAVPPGGVGSAGGWGIEAPEPRPFFEGFLEGQVPGDGGLQTMAYPSDSDADGGRPGIEAPEPIIVTMAYPSDSDADGGRPIGIEAPEPGPRPGIEAPEPRPRPWPIGIEAPEPGPRPGIEAPEPRPRPWPIGIEAPEPGPGPSPGIEAPEPFRKPHWFDLARGAGPEV
ncbi:hypothetical protein DYH09_07800 [bacterium CPR1]|nr:hypothetical protein [bacterium CPR1]